MKRLVAKRSVLYLGRMYKPGELLPAFDGSMVDAWLRARSAEWYEDEKKAEAEAEAETETEAEAETETEAEAETETEAEAETETGTEPKINDEFHVGSAGAVAEAKLGITINPVEGSEENENAETGQIAGHLDAAELEKNMSRENLNRLAADVGADISEAKNKGDVARAIAAVSIQANHVETIGEPQ